MTGEGTATDDSAARWDSAHIGTQEVARRTQARTAEDRIQFMLAVPLTTGKTIGKCMTRYALNPSKIAASSTPAGIQRTHRAVPGVIIRLTSPESAHGNGLGKPALRFPFADQLAH